MCYSLEMDLFPRPDRERELDLTDNTTLGAIEEAAGRNRLRLVCIPGMGGVQGYQLILDHESEGCACGIAHETWVDSTVVDFARSLTRSLDLEAVRLVWRWSTSESLSEQAMTFEEFSERNRETRLAENTPYLLKATDSASE